MGDGPSLGRLGIVAIAFLSGAALTSQVGMNNTLRQRMGHPVLAAFISFGVGTLMLGLALLLLRPALPGRSILSKGPFWMWTGGMVGALYIMSAATFSSKLGAAAWIGLIVAGQIVGSLALDHFGLLGFTQRPINLPKILGAILLMLGVIQVPAILLSGILQNEICRYLEGRHTDATKPHERT